MTRDRPKKPIGPVAPDVCPVCGEDVPEGALACPGCGADADTGWNEEATAADGLDLPDDEGFDYDAFVQREFGEPRASAGRWKTWAGATLAVLAAAILLMLWIFGD